MSRGLPPIHTLAELKQPFENPDYHDPMNPPASQLETEARENWKQTQEKGPRLLATPSIKLLATK